MNKLSLTWKIAGIFVTALLLLPIIALFYTSIGNTDEVFAHLLSTVMPTYIYNTFVLVFGVIGVSLILGVPSAWLIAMCQFPSKKILQWALVLPLAMPSYIVAYIYTDWLDFAGPIQNTLRKMTGWQAQEYWFPDIRTLFGAVVVLSFTLFPYVYLLARNAFLSQGESLLQSARLLNCSPWRSFITISLPLARPAIAIGLSLVAMEALGDFGAVSYFAVNTLTTAVYDTWLGMSSLTAAAKISSIMLLCVVLFISFERYSRRRLSAIQLKYSGHQLAGYQLTGWKKWATMIWCWGLVCLAFLLPFLQLCFYAFQYLEKIWTMEFSQYAINSFYVAILSALIAVIFALILNAYQRLAQNRVATTQLRLSSLGYAVPGTVLAIGVMVPILFIEHALNDGAKMLGWTPFGLILSGSSLAVILAMVVRFSAVAIGSIESNLNKIPQSLDCAARINGSSANNMLRRVHFPLLRRGILIAFLLVFIESMKELNATLLLRPFNFETLATYVFNFASDEQLELAAMPAVLLVFVGLVPLILINRSLEKNHG